MMFIKPKGVAQTIGQSIERLCGVALLHSTFSRSFASRPRRDRANFRA